MFMLALPKLTSIESTGCGCFSYVTKVKDTGE